MSRIGNVVMPAQEVKVDTPQGVEPIWYERMKQLEKFASLFSEIDPATLTAGQTVRWDNTKKKFLAGA
jgi:hypothetical protein